MSHKDSKKLTLSCEYTTNYDTQGYDALSPSNRRLRWTSWTGLGQVLFTLAGRNTRSNVLKSCKWRTPWRYFNSKTWRYCGTIPNPITDQPQLFIYFSIRWLNLRIWFWGLSSFSAFMSLGVGSFSNTDSEKERKATCPPTMTSALSTLKEHQQEISKHVSKSWTRTRQIFPISLIMLSVVTGLEDNMKLQRPSQTPKSLFYSKTNMSKQPRDKSRAPANLYILPHQSVTGILSLLTVLTGWSPSFHLSRRCVALLLEVACSTRITIQRGSVERRGQGKGGTLQSPHSAAQICRQFSWGHRGAGGIYQRQIKRKKKATLKGSSASGTQERGDRRPIQKHRQKTNSFRNTVKENIGLQSEWWSEQRSRIRTRTNDTSSLLGS